MRLWAAAVSCHPYRWDFLLGTAGVIPGFKSAVRGAVRSILARVNLKLSRLDAPFENTRCYIPFKPTIAAAAAAGMTVGDYIEAHYDTPGVARETLARMRDLGVFAEPVRVVCEIGPGSGRYLAETLRMCSPERYEIYETAARWAHWLVQKYGVVLRPTNGSTLAHTPSGSVDLAHAHKTFPALSFLSTCRYLAEMARVVRVGGKVVFDVVTEDCMDARTLRDWLATGSGYGEYPNVMPRSEIEDLFARLKLRCEGEFLESMKPGVTHYFVTVKYASQD